MKRGRLLVIDDEPDIAGYIGTVAEELGYDVTETTDAESFLAAFGREKPDVIVVDVVMPRIDGIELIRRVARAGCAARVLIISGYTERYFDDAKALGEAIGLSSITAMRKPIELAELERWLSGGDGC